MYPSRIVLEKFFPEYHYILPTLCSETTKLIVAICILDHSSKWWYTIGVNGVLCKQLAMYSGIIPQAWTQSMDQKYGYALWNMDKDVVSYVCKTILR